MRILTSSVAILALAATGAIAQGQGNGNGQGNRGNDRGGPPAAAQGGPDANGNGNARRGGPPAAAQGNRGNGNADRGGPPAQAQQGRVERGNGNANNANAAARNADRGNIDRGNGQRPAVERGAQRIERDLRGNGNGNANRNAAVVRGNNQNGGNDARFVDRIADRYVQPEGRYGGSFGYSPSLIDGCPPGLAKKNNGCQPPGLARQRAPYGSLYQPDLFGLTGYDRGNYFYDGGYLLRRSGSDIAGYIPLLGGALSVGNQWPGSYGSSSLPDYYVDYYGLGGPQNYRYADDAIYRVDPTTSAIQSIAALLTGDQFTVGQPMPRGYDVYNVPYAYRDRYYDTPEANYRYSDGYVYRVDPQTQLVAAAIDLLT
ncbi:MAG: hypothetical protein MK010_04420 [Erythrobacter sp.]|nr:hypothetical protein [Erythrobacter sp.]